jgi:hypothetical protein
VIVGSGFKHPLEFGHTAAGIGSRNGKYVGKSLCSDLDILEIEISIRYSAVHAACFASKEIGKTTRFSLTGNGNYA